MGSSSSKLWLIVLLLALTMIAEAATSMTTDDAWVLSYVGGKVEDETEMLMDSEINRRTLGERGGKYISYAALRANNVPCNRRGQSYYNCRRRTRANPYRRGCSAITRCKRYTK
ncbi:protein RALF-like 19 [Tripterygium wilfordii]|uniref:Protein RALF-like 19 n=1 Tax=Tripterygium wilfordii TaxID=458696 RepID=A0A7J7C1A6_TRIWF|nr:protein RALF-like 19 [Tripterygium wilfordii]KAF5727888.1 protein RALF-like 19 [Tripterygium wilfordii]